MPYTIYGKPYFLFDSIYHILSTIYYTVQYILVLINSETASPEVLLRGLGCAPGWPPGRGRRPQREGLSLGESFEGLGGVGFGRWLN